MINLLNKLHEFIGNKRKLLFSGLFILLLSYITEIKLLPKEISRLFFLLFILLSIFAAVIHTQKYILSKTSIVFFKPKLFKYARLLFCVFSIFTALQHITLVRSGLEPMNEFPFSQNELFVYTLNAIYIIVLTSLFFGKYIRLCWIIVFLTGGLLIPFSIETFIKMPFVFYAIFIPPSLWKGNDEKEPGNATGVLMMLFSYAMLITCAGIFKLFDPVWMSGYGIYYTLNTPCLLPKPFWFILDYEWLMISMNYFAIFTQIIIFPLAVFKKTRFMSVVFIGLFALFLSIGMYGIGLYCGPTLLVISLIFISLTYKTSYYKYQEKSSSRFKYSFVYVILVWWTISGFYPKFYRTFSKAYASEYPKFGPFIIASNSDEKSTINWRNEVLMTVVSLSRPPQLYEPSFIIPLFDYYHLFERYIFKVEFETENGEVIEPIKFFNPDGSYHMNYPFFQNERFLLTNFRIMELRQYSYSNIDILENYRKNKLKKEIDGLINYCLEYVPQPSQVVNAKVKIKLLKQPYNYKGNYKQWRDNEYQEFVRYSFQDNKTQIYPEALDFYEFNKLQIDPFKKGIIKPKYYHEYDQ